MRVKSETKNAIQRVDNKVLKEAIDKEVYNLVEDLKVRKEDVRFTQGAIYALEEVLNLLKRK